MPQSYTRLYFYDMKSLFGFKLLKFYLNLLLHPLYRDYFIYPRHFYTLKGIFLGQPVISRNCTGNPSSSLSTFLFFCIIFFSSLYLLFSLLYPTFLGKCCLLHCGSVVLTLILLVYSFQCFLNCFIS